MEQGIKKPKILIFDDDELIREFYKMTLSRAGFEVKTFENYKDVVNIVLEEKPDIIWCDILMPEPMNGFGALELLKKNRETHKIPVVIVSNVEEPQDINRGFKLGADDYFLKIKYTPSKLAEILKGHLLKNSKFSKNNFKK
ncbi:MAG: response regulator [Candidatus Nealsonbacteria bacterium]|nr:response regulator [Candidatus Nealsonbacteria bacterium]